MITFLFSYHLASYLCTVAKVCRSVLYIEYAGSTCSYRLLVTLFLPLPAVKDTVGLVSSSKSRYTRWEIFIDFSFKSDFRHVSWFKTNLMYTTPISLDKHSFSILRNISSSNHEESSNWFLPNIVKTNKDLGDLTAFRIISIAAILRKMRCDQTIFWYFVVDYRSGAEVSPRGRFRHINLLVSGQFSHKTFIGSLNKTFFELFNSKYQESWFAETISAD